MRARRGVYIAFFLVAALGASALVYFAQPRNGIVRAKVDIAVLTPITAEMVELISVSPADAPANAARTLDAVVGRYASVAILAGQDVDVRILDVKTRLKFFEGEVNCSVPALVPVAMECVARRTAARVNALWPRN